MLPTSGTGRVVLTATVVGGLSLGARRAILDLLLTVTVNPNPKRVPRQPDGGYLDRDSIGIAWKAGKS